jgi:hypothetical protein
MQKIIYENVTEKDNSSFVYQIKKQLKNTEKINEKKRFMKQTDPTSNIPME